MEATVLKLATLEEKFEKRSAQVQKSCKASLPQPPELSPRAQHSALNGFHIAFELPQKYIGGMRSRAILPLQDRLCMELCLVQAGHDRERFGRIKLGLMEKYDAALTAAEAQLRELLAEVAALRSGQPVKKPRRRR